MSLFRRLKKSGYRIHLLFLWLPAVEMAIQRVKDRVRRGGHSVPDSDIRRRFDRGIRNLLSEYHPLLDTWALFDNSVRPPRLIALWNGTRAIEVDGPLFQAIKGGIH